MTTPLIDRLMDRFPPVRPSESLQWGFRFHRTMESSAGYVWPEPGNWAEAPGPILDHTGPCPRAVGDGICVGKNIRGAQSGGYRHDSGIVLIVGWRPSDVLGKDGSKVRLSCAWVGRRISWDDLRSHLSGVDMSRANLYGANLTDANLTGTDLSRANLSRANLSDADLTNANLTGAWLPDANLTGVR